MPPVKIATVLLRSVLVLLAIGGSNLDAVVFQLALRWELDRARKKSSGNMGKVTPRKTLWNVHYMQIVRIIWVHNFNIYP